MWVEDKMSVNRRTTRHNVGEARAAQKTRSLQQQPPHFLVVLRVFTKESNHKVRLLLLSQDVLVFNEINLDTGRISVLKERSW